jgi:FlaA1/EpsC-like NDP-sugar epimerase
VSTARRGRASHLREKLLSSVQGCWSGGVVGQTIRGGRSTVSDIAVAASERRSGWASARTAVWTRAYLRRAFLIDVVTGFLTSTAALGLRFGGHITREYAILSLAFPVLWVAALRLSGAYDARFIGTGSDEFRKVLTAGVSLTAAIAIFSYGASIELSRGYLVIALPAVTLFDLMARYVIRKRLHQLRTSGHCLLNVVAVGHELAVTDLVTELRRDAYHGMRVIGACVARPGECDEVAGVPVYPALFTQTRVGKDGRPFRMYKFRTMVVDAEQREQELMAAHARDHVLFRLRREPRVTAVGAMSVLLWESGAY